MAAGGKSDNPYEVSVFNDDTAGLITLQLLVALGHCPECRGPVTLEKGGTVFVKHTDETCQTLIGVAEAAETPNETYRRPR